ncbi:AsnC family transcriptional regulator [Haloferax prahovense DSM 18310]|uniref:AsnC family transcriptional regulator n=1 Tax=Haloferax prahovense (strain DSM 18310 / JCM 13924 / TL6) TaxID=1227461 RepID=M0GJJ5_HALPT|nr:winged helix-turn-helix transcriptional regulator [Haloferax prahovense]ELZ71738.1 AsnC family transcriptional regulator [Haloferax prahovense DSM 18310]
METTSTEGRILAVLEEDAKASYAQIADRADVSKPTVRKYIRKLEDDGVIIGYSADIDPKKLAGQSIAMVGIDATSERYVEVTRILKELDSVEALYTSCLLYTVISDEILSIDGVTAAHPSFLQERLK